MITVDDCTGIAENGLPVFTVYPNPGVDVLNINLRVTRDETYSVVVRNLLGQTVCSRQGRGSGIDEIVRVNIADIPEGAYIIGVSTTSGGTSYRKYIVAK
jgi:hypothetical protein